MKNTALFLAPQKRPGLKWAQLRVTALDKYWSVIKQRAMAYSVRYREGLRALLVDINIRFERLVMRQGVMQSNKQLTTSVVIIVTLLQIRLNWH